MSYIFNLIRESGNSSRQISPSLESLKARIAIYDNHPEYMEFISMETLSSVAVEMIGQSHAGINDLRKVSSAYVKRNGSLSVEGYAMLNVAVSSLSNQVGEPQQAISIESFDDLGSYQATTIALEGVGDTLKKLWEKFKKFVSDTWNRIKAFFKNLFSKKKKVEESAKKAEAKAKEVKKKYKLNEVFFNKRKLFELFSRGIGMELTEELGGDVAAMGKRNMELLERLGEWVKALMGLMEFIGHKFDKIDSTADMDTLTKLSDEIDAEVKKTVKPFAEKGYKMYGGVGFLPGVGKLMNVDGDSYIDPSLFGLEVPYLGVAKYEGNDDDTYKDDTVFEIVSVISVFVGMLAMLSANAEEAYQQVEQSIQRTKETHFDGPEYVNYFKWVFSILNAFNPVKSINFWYNLIELQTKDASALFDMLTDGKGKSVAVDDLDTEE